MTTSLKPASSSWLNVFESVNPSDLTAEERAELAYLLPRKDRKDQRLHLESSLYAFVQAAWPHIESSEYIDNWHIQAICEHLQAVTSNQIKRLLVNIPPGCSKSLLVSVFWPCWEWTSNPQIRWFFSSYDQRLSTRDSVKCRALINSRWYQDWWGGKFNLVHDQNQKTYFQTSLGGYRLATSIGGHGTGEHPDRIVADDPHNVEQAESDVERQGVLQWWDLTMSTRGVSRDARRVIIMQRLHHEDLSGHVLARGDYTHICLPMRYEPERMPVTPLGWTDPRTGEGELLTPNQFDEEKVAEQEKNLGAYGTAGQLQQNPTPREGGMFKEIWFSQRIKAAPYEARRIRYWDRAATEGAGCWTAGVLLALGKDGNYYIENVVRGQWEPDRRNEEMKAVALRDRTRYGPSQEPAIYVEAEGGSSGRDAWKGVARALAGFPVREDKVTGDKATRAEPWACQLAAKNVFLVDNGEAEGLGRADWDIAAYVLEHCQFPLGKYLDQVDSSCLVAGTLVETLMGMKPIEQIQAGESVRTRQGWKQVEWSGQTGIAVETVSVLFANGSVVSGTPEHLVWTWQRGWISLDSLCGADNVILSPAWGNQQCGGKLPNSSKGIKASTSANVAAGSRLKSSGFITRMASRNTGRAIAIARSIRKKLSSTVFPISAALAEGISRGMPAGSRCIRRSGSFIMGTSPVAIRYTTRTVTGTTTRLRILNASLLRSIPTGILEEGLSQDSGSIWIRLVGRLRSGTVRQKVGNGTGNMARKYGKARRSDAISVNGVARYSNRGVPDRNSVLLDAPLDPGSTGRMGGEPSRRFALCATRFSWASGECDAAPENVEQSTVGNGLGVPVYDLKVRDAHEFFANGILVHNSGAFNLLVGNRLGNPPLRTFRLGGKKPVGLRIILCTESQLAGLVLEQRCLLVVVRNVGNGQGLPPHGLHKLQDSLILQCDDIQPAELQDDWQEPPEAALFTTAMGKALWGKLLRKRTDPLEAIVLADAGTRIAESIGLAVCDLLGLERAKCLYRLGHEDWQASKETKPANAFIHSQVRMARSMVV